MYKLIKVESPGTLKDLILALFPFKEAEISVSGKLNADDLKFIQDIWGYLGTIKLRQQFPEAKDFQIPKLLNVDLSDTEAKSINLSFTHIQNVVLPKEIKLLNDSFQGCAELKDITLPETLEEIGDYTFYGCNSLEAIHIPASVSKIGIHAFPISPEARLYSISIDGENRHFKIYRGSLLSKDGIRFLAYLPSSAANGASYFTLPFGVEIIDKGAFPEYIERDLDVPKDNIVRYNLSKRSLSTIAINQEQGLQLYYFSKIFPSKYPLIMKVNPKYPKYSCNFIVPTESVQSMEDFDKNMIIICGTNDYSDHPKELLQKSSPVVRYDSPEECVLDGWMFD